MQNLFTHYTNTYSTYEVKWKNETTKEATRVAMAWTGQALAPFWNQGFKGSRW